MMAALAVVKPILSVLKTAQSLLPTWSMPVPAFTPGKMISVDSRKLQVSGTWSLVIAAVFWLTMTSARRQSISSAAARATIGFAGTSAPIGWVIKAICLVNKVQRRWALLVLAINLARWVIPKIVDKVSSPIGAKWATKLISRSLALPNVGSSRQRQVFNELPLVSSKVQQNHTHGTAARDRNTSSATSALAARALGFEPYFIQQSLSDVRKARAGDRSFHWAKDLAIPPAEFSFDPAEHAAVLVDVDHYINMPSLLAQKPGTYFVCTFQPTTSAESVGEYSFRFLRDGQISYRVSGGAEYVHQIWDYSGDTLLVEDSGLLQKRVVAYHIDRKRVDDHHVVIMLTVIGQFTTIAALPTSLLIEGKPLKRFNPVIGNHVVIDVVKADGLYRSIAPIGGHTAVTLPKSQFDAVLAVAHVAKVPITPAMVASNIVPSSPAGLPTERLPPGHAAIIADYTREGVPESPPVVYPPSASMLVVSFDKHDYSAPVSLTGFGSPLIGPCYGFPSSIASDDQCIAGRVEAFQGKPVEPILPSVAGYMQEFVEFLVPTKHRGHPVGDDEVHQRQDRPSQRSVLNEAAVTGNGYKRAWAAFVKKETYQKPTDPRNISIAAPATKLAYSRYQYAFTDDIMSNAEWYAFNKNPAQIAARVCDVLVLARWSVIADGSRFDGHVTRSARVLERMCMLRFFAVDHHSGLNEAMDEQIALPGTTEHGRKYQSGYSRGSGSLETANFNSILTAFIGYCAQRETTVGGVRKSPDQAWASLGVYGGDDSLEGDVDADALRRSASIMGQEYDVEVIRRGDIGINFLNRQFGPNVWNGDPSSMANPARLLSKLWVGPAHLTNVLQRFGERMSGYYRMDRNSPVIGPLTILSHELLGEYVDGELAPWDGQFSADVNWPNVDSGWMDDLFDQFIPDFDRERFGKFLAVVRERRDPGLLLRAPLCTSAGEVVPVAVKKVCIVGDTLEIPTPKADDPSGADDSVAADGHDDEFAHRANGAGVDLGYVSEEEVDDETDKVDSPAIVSILPAEQSVATVVSSNYTEAEKAVIGPASVKVVGRFKPTILPEQAVWKPARELTSSSSSRSPVRAGKTKAGELKASVDPNNWFAPHKREGETDGAFKARSLEWETKRARVAKRLGVTLTGVSAPTKK